MKQEIDKQQFRERFSDKILEENMKSVVEEILDIVVTSYLKKKKALAIFVDEVISKVVNDDVHQVAREEMEFEIGRCSEWSCKCKCQSEISALCEKLSKFYAKINEKV